LIFELPVDREQEEVGDGAEVKKHGGKAENLCAYTSDGGRLMVPLLMEVENYLAITARKRNDRYDQEGEGRQIENSQIRVPFESMAR